MAAPKRFFVEKISDEVTLTGEEFRHASQVLRLKAGDEVTLLDGSGYEYSAVIASAQKREMLLSVREGHLSSREPKTNVTLLFGALKGDKSELVVQKAVELGVANIGLFLSRYSSVSFGENKLERLNRVAKEAAKQCLRARVPEIALYNDLSSALASAQSAENKLFACEFLESGSPPPLTLSGETALVIGSEGGFSREEYEEALALGYQGVTLGSRILRAETASIALLSVAMRALGEWA